MAVRTDRWNNFRQLILEDYQQVRHRLEQRRIREQPSAAKKACKSKLKDYVTPISQASEPLEKTKPLALRRLGQLVRQVKSFAQLLRGLEPELASGGDSNTEEYCSPSASDLARDFLKRCPNALLQYEITYEHVKSAELFPLALKVHPRVSTLVTKGSDDGR
ncbi:hypothetical protein BG000_001135 [Podila horticola]|nr:hypothetical protein BG000_001135 [Podila horticola]